jgi:hypothetical protein
LNVLLHALAQISPFRDFWLDIDNYKLSKSNIVHHFGSVMRKMWSSNNFKSTVSPQELMQEINIESKKTFAIASRSMCLDLLIWLLGKLHKGMDGSTKHMHSSVVYEPFQGVIEVRSLTKKLVSSADEVVDKNKLDSGSADEEWVETVTEMPFTHLSLDIPPCPLFRDSHGGLVIPQMPLFEVLQKFDGETWTDTVNQSAHIRKQYKIKKLPRYLILHLVRFTKNNFNLEKNPTIVTFPVKNLELRDYVSNPPAASSSVTCTMENIQEMSQKDLQSYIEKRGSELQKKQLRLVVEKSQPIKVQGNLPATAAAGVDASEALLDDLRVIAGLVLDRELQALSTKYDLVANICHDSRERSQTVTVGDVNLGNKSIL